ncbi:MAG: hypothetical protein MH252_04765 [Thermosynechococcaceae cyanobacterium MS004]|nr:hypothetical protein [Thermosynechococcaceae cyanobacterium MS004]
MTSLNLVDSSQNLADLLTQLEDGNPIVLEQQGEEVAALITMHDLRLLTHLIEAEEDRVDLADAQEVLAQTQPQDWIALEDLKAELSL